MGALDWELLKFEVGGGGGGGRGSRRIFPESFGKLMQTNHSHQS